MLFWKPFSEFCCTLKTANNEPIHFKLAVNHTGDSSIKWSMKVEHFLLHFKEIKYAKKYPIQAPIYQIFMKFPKNVENSHFFPISFVLTIKRDIAKHLVIFFSIVIVTSVFNNNLEDLSIVGNEVEIAIMLLVVR